MHFTWHTTKICFTTINTANWGYAEKYALCKPSLLRGGTADVYNFCRKSYTWTDVKKKWANIHKHCNFHSLEQTEHTNTTRWRIVSHSNIPLPQPQPQCSINWYGLIEKNIQLLMKPPKEQMDANGCPTQPVIHEPQLSNVKTKSYYLSTQSFKSIGMVVDFFQCKHDWNGWSRMTLRTALHDIYMDS